MWHINSSYLQLCVIFNTQIKIYSNYSCAKNIYSTLNVFMDNLFIKLKLSKLEDKWHFLEWICKKISDSRSLACLPADIAIIVNEKNWCPHSGSVTVRFEWLKMNEINELQQSFKAQKDKMSQVSSFHENYFFQLTGPL